MRSQSYLLATASVAAVLACDPARQPAKRAVTVPPPTPPVGQLTEVMTETLAALGSPPTPLAGFYNITEFPQEQKENVTTFLAQAQSLATHWQIYQYFQDQCITVQAFPKLFTQPAGFVTPFSPFDNFYFVGHGFVSSWAYDTGDGLFVIDALDSSEEVEGIMLPALEKFGFSGKDIKHVIITHEHLDHYGGARYLKETYNATIYASEVAWLEMETYDVPDNSTSKPPDRDQTVEDGQVLQIRNFSVEVVLTPGHTPGTLSLIFPLTSNNGTDQHVAGFNGGTGMPTSASDLTLKVQSHFRFASIAYSRGADTLVTNHQVADHALFASDLLAHSNGTSPNPFVVGRDNYYNYLQVLGLCTKVYAARQGKDIWA